LLFFDVSLAPDSVTVPTFQLGFGFLERPSYKRDYFARQANARGPLSRCIEHPLSGQRARQNEALAACELEHQLI
jgi:hypothetical protein